MARTFLSANRAGMPRATKKVGNLSRPASRVECKRSVKSLVQSEWPSDADLGKLLITWRYSLRKWWNWQTHHLEGVAPKGVGVQIPPSAP